MASLNSSGIRAILLLCAFVVATSAMALSSFGRGNAGNSKRAMPAKPLDASRILQRYLDATGGRDAWGRVHSRVSKGVVEIPDMHMAGTAELFEKAPDRALVKMVVSGVTFLEGFDGTTAWSSDPKDGLQEQRGLQLAETRRESDFRYPLDLPNLYKGVSSASPEKIGDRPVYVLELTPPEGGEPDRAYFDTQTGFLTRTVIQHHDNDGSVKPFEEDYGDYRAVDGVKVPFMIRQAGSQVDFVIRLNEVRQNVELDDAQFSMPASSVVK